MSTIRFIHWKKEEAIPKARILKDAGFEVRSDPPAGPRFLQELESQDPDAVVIDLSRIPSQGRDIAVSIRRRKGTRHIPIVFVGGDPAKVERIKGLLPDAGYGSWDDVIATVEQAIEAGVEDPVVPDSAFAAYTGKPLADKLGIRAGSRVAYIRSPSEFVATLGELPPDVVLADDVMDHADLIIWFARSAEQLGEDLEAIADASKAAPVWIAWPKKGSANEADLTQVLVRKTAMAAGMVDYKICSIDRNWSALLFTWRGIAT
jgi:CheY-like chemotaxis protein